MYVLLALKTVMVLYLVKDHYITATSCPKKPEEVWASLKPGWKYEIQSPSNYQPNQTCTWKVSFPNSMGSLRSSYQVMLVFDALEIEPCTSCTCDWFAYTYSENYLPSHYKKCSLYSKNAIANLKEIGSGNIHIKKGYNELWLKFHSDGSSEFKGFKAKITVVNTGSCYSHFKVIINETSGSISSPKYPLQYKANQCIKWRLIAPNGFRVKLTFNDFDLENDRTDANDCSNDYVEIRDFKPWRWGEGELLGRFCGSTIPKEPIFSLSNEMSVLFVSDNNAQTVHKGFKAHFQIDGSHRSNTSSYAVSGSIQVKPSFTYSALAMLIVFVKKAL